jgi:hypothetical protein
VAEEALGLDDSTDSIIVDLGGDEDIPLDAPRVRVSDVMEPVTAPDSAGDNAPANEHDEPEVDDAESDYFESDDPESDLDSAEDDVDGPGGEPDELDPREDEHGPRDGESGPLED